MPAGPGTALGCSDKHLTFKKRLHSKILLIERSKHASQEQVNATLSKLAKLRGGEHRLSDIEDDAGDGSAWRGGNWFSLGSRGTPYAADRLRIDKPAIKYMMM